MSLAAQTNQASVAPARRESPGRRLRAVEAPARRRRPRVLYAIVAVAGAVAIGAAQMALSILTTQGSYQLATLTSQQRELSWQKQMLYDDVAGLSSPQYLAANASALGMVINESPSYLRLSDGAILGSNQVALGASSVDALNRAAVGNALITDTPLVTDPDATIQGAPLPDPTTLADGMTGTDGTTPVSNTPPPLTDGLPTPSTH
ncbi:hypothetical protein G5T42_16655 [Microbacterium sp. 4R-513]|uniref:hypothetical protein n=1 Tax=Microbacterium sp. 4R-513 TaxID=2567934 RepID=UPI0013E1EDF2|nr:hypothetical protein [Microbacterium sp. 4R-513]QIG40903.1 hypothetical protein G5T42_16655 [Microbacterium sp. 4R-513]